METATERGADRVVCTTPSCQASVGRAGTFVEVSVEVPDAIRWHAGTDIVDGRPVPKYVEGGVKLRICLECANRHIVPLSGMTQMRATREDELAP